MTEADGQMLDASVQVLKNLFSALRELPVADAMRPISELDERTRAKYSRKDRKDTRFIDIVAEDALSVGCGFSGHVDAMLRAYGTPGVIITEECGRVPRATRIEHDTPVIISDPVDSTSYFEDIMRRLAAAGDRVGAA
ncbi:MAG TPA: hypothetical protein VJB16_01440, partial [archaeon]|nr:hypothetical protein [archaeon]